MNNKNVRNLKKHLKETCDKAIKEILFQFVENQKLSPEVQLSPFDCSIKFDLLIEKEKEKNNNLSVYPEMFQIVCRPRIKF